jgi:hypothetical protein
MLLKRWDGNLAVTGVALVIAVGEPRCKFSQVALPDWLTAQRTERLRAGCPAIHQDEFHMPPPRSVSCAWTRVASRQQRKLQMRSLQRKFIEEPPRTALKAGRGNLASPNQMCARCWRPTPVFVERVESPRYSTRTPRRVSLLTKKKAPLERGCCRRAILPVRSL